MRVTIVAEAAQGFEGKAALGRQLARAAASAGADLVKFQLVYVDELAVPGYVHYDIFKSLEMPRGDWESIVAEARGGGIGVAFDVFGRRSLDLAIALGAAAVKIHASDFFNGPLVADALRRAPHTYISTGGVEAAEVDAFLMRHPDATSRATFLCGFQAEPTATADNHLARLGSFRARFPQLKTGFMEHADGGSDETAWLGVLALPYGITAIEKHITLDRSLQLEDFVSAASPEQFAAFVGRFRSAESALGSADLTLSAAELQYRRKALKPVVAARALAVGEAIGPDAVTLLRAPLAADRQPLFQLESVVGRRIARDVAAGEPIYEDDVPRTA